MNRSKKLDELALTALRKARRKRFGSPAWGDHVLHNVRAFTTAKRLVVTTGRSILEKMG